MKPKNKIEKITILVNGVSILWSDYCTLAGYIEIPAYDKELIPVIAEKIRKADLTDLLNQQLEFQPVMSQVEARGVGFRLSEWFTKGMPSHIDRLNHINHEIAKTLMVPDASIVDNKSLVAVARKNGRTIENMSIGWLKQHSSNPLFRLVMKRQLEIQFICQWQTNLHERHRSKEFVYLRGTWSGYSTLSGRCSASDLPLMAIPSEMKAYMCPENADEVYVSFDLREIELRIAAVLANCDQLKSAFRADIDVHELTAQHITGRKEVTKYERQIGKRINYAFLYGAGQKTINTIASRIGDGISLNVFQNFCNAYPELYQLRRRYKSARWLEIGGKRRKLKASAFTVPQRLNIPVQSLGATILKQTAISLEMLKGFDVVNLIHDEIVVRMARCNFTEISKIISDEITKIVREVVPGICTTSLVKILKIGGSNIEWR